MLKIILIALMISVSLGFSETNINKEEIVAKDSSAQNVKLLGYGLMVGGFVVALIGLSSANGEKEYNPSTGVNETKVNSGGAVALGAGMLSVFAGMIIIHNSTD
jgi:hypothetical protein